MQTLATLALKSDPRITEEGQDQLVHGRFRECTSLPSFAPEFRRSLDIFFEVFVNV